MKSIIRVLMISATLAAISVRSSAQFSLSVGISIHTAPPAIPVYTQPPCPYDGWLWTPGYWAYGDAGYYWVPGVWVRPPQIGFLWTPGYWGFAGGIYGWHGGYWGPHVGFYGGVNYGCGYGGVGYGGGMWQGGSFRYNTAVTQVNTTVIHNTYVNNTVINNTTVNNRSSFNGPGGVQARPTAQEQSYARETHVQPTSEQFSHNQTASKDRNQLASVNGGRPQTTAMNRVGGQRFNQQGHAPANAPANVNHPAAMNTHSTAAANRPAVQSNRPMNVQNRTANQPTNHTMQSTGHMAAPANHPMNRPAPAQHQAVAHQAAPHQAAPHQNQPHPGGEGGGHRRER